VSEILARRGGRRIEVGAHARAQRQRHLETPQHRNVELSRFRVLPGPLDSRAYGHQIWRALVGVTAEIVVEEHAKPVHTVERAM
jgi:hypothetical protein